MFGNSYYGKTYYAPVYFGPTVAIQESGGSKKVRDARGRKLKKLTQEEIEGLEAFGKARMGIVEEIPIIPEIPIPQSQEIEYIVDSPVIPESEIFSDSQVSQVDEIEGLEAEQDIGLILALITAHNN